MSFYNRRQFRQEQGEWVLTKSQIKKEFEVLKRSKEQLQGLYNDDQKKCAALAQQLANVTMQLTIRDEALKEVQNEL
jgi:hypothetical protein